MSLRPRMQRLLVGAVAGLFVLSLPTGVSANSDLQKAYEKEFAHLESQKRALEKRLRELDRKMEESISEAEGERDRLQGKLLSLQQKGDALEKKLERVRRESKSKGRGDEILRSTLEQAASSLESSPVDVDAPKEGEAANYRRLVPSLFEKATRVIDRSRSMRREEGQFFLPDGTKTQGTILRIGNVAAYGVTEQQAGALAPAGDGRLKLWKAEKTRGVAREMEAGETPATLRAFLFESLEEGVEKRAEKTWLSTIQAGGVIAWVIVGLGALGVVLILFRVVRLAIAGYRSRRTIEAIEADVATGDLERAVETCGERSDAASRVVGAAVENLDRSREELEDLVSEAMLREAPRLERFGTAILVFAAVAPLLGLLGTVTGMISTFEIITEFGTGDPRMLSGGISEALITTQLGLMAAIPLLLVGNLLKGWTERLLTRLERGALRVLNVAGVGSDDEDDRTAAVTALPEVQGGVDSRDGDDESWSEQLGAI